MIKRWICTIFILSAVLSVPVCAQEIPNGSSLEPAKIVFEQATIAADSRPGRALWNEFFHSAHGLLKANYAYHISFDYKVIARASDASFYALVRSASHAGN